MHVTKVRGQLGEALLDVDVGAVPAEDRAHRKCVAEVMQAWAPPVRVSAQAALVRQLDERPPEDPPGHASTLLGEKEAWCLWPRVDPVSSIRVVPERPLGGWMDGNQARLAELGATDGEDATVEIDVVTVEADDLARAHPRHRE